MVRGVPIPARPGNVLSEMAKSGKRKLAREDKPSQKTEDTARLLRKAATNHRDSEKLRKQGGERTARGRKRES
jgi:hypothetical protein